MSQIQNPTHRIGAVSALSGVPVPTLRVWEARYGALKPTKTGGSHRLYTEEDVLRASLLRQLTGCGHAISRIAALSASQLSALLYQQRQSQDRVAVQQQTPHTVNIAVIGLELAARLQSSAFLAVMAGVGVHVTDTFKDVDEACGQPLRAQPEIVVVKVNSLHMATHAALRRLISCHTFGQLIVLYSYGQERVIEAMKLAGMMVRREPVSDSELADLLRAVLLIDPRRANDHEGLGILIPPRKYSDQTLAKVARISNNMLCECPRHVAELITQLASFEQYSQECLNNSQQDAHLHAQLSAVSGSARALFERALEMVATHEGIVLESDAPTT